MRRWASRLGTARLLSAAAVLAVVALAGWTIPRLRVSTEITDFLPAGRDREAAHVARVMSASELQRTITLTVAGEHRLGAAAELARRMARHPDVERVQTGPSDEFERAFYDLYFPRRLLFYADDPAEALSDEELRDAAHDLRLRLSSPAGPLVREIAPRDPLGAFRRQL